MNIKYALLLSILGFLFSCEGSKEPVDYLPPADADCAGENIQFQLKSGDILAGTLTYPKSFSKKLPAVIFITGSSAHDRDNGHPFTKKPTYRPFRQLAHYLSSNGIATLRLDDRGVGASIGGNIKDMNTVERADDIRQAVEYLKGRKEIDTLRIGLVGLSEGACISQMIASENPSIKAIVSMAGAGSTGKELIEHQKSKGLFEGVEDVDEFIAENKWFNYFYNEYDPLKTARLVHVPTLILHGKTDRRIPFSDAHNLANAIRENGNSNVTIKVLPEYNHLLIKETPDGRKTGYGRLPSLNIPIEVLEIINQWLLQNI